MKPQDNTPHEFDLLHSSEPDTGPILNPIIPLDPHPDADLPVASRLPRNVAIAFSLMLLLVIGAFFGTRLWARHALRTSLPQLDGALSLPGLTAPVTVLRDAHGVPSIRAASVDDLIVAQGFVTAQDRLWQMETLRRHAAGTLAELLGSSLLPHDRTQRTLQLRAAADRAIAVLAANQLHFLELYARGVNASIDQQRPHLPLEFRLLRDDPAPWIPRDSILISLVMFQDLTNGFPQKLSREALSTRLPSALLADLYPVGSWRDHPPSLPPIDLTAPVIDVPNVPLDESQSRLNSPANSLNERPATDIATLLTLIHSQSLTCESCLPGSNNWAVSGVRTASGKPLLSNDMHLSHSAPGIWYETSLEAPTASGTSFHVAGVALPGTPFVIVGHNEHIAWGFTNLGADVQDLYVERTRVHPNGPDHRLVQEFQTPDGAWSPVLHQREVIHVRGGKDVVLDVPATQHGSLITPIISGLLAGGNARPAAGAEVRNIALSWTIYDPANLTSPFYGVNSAKDWPSILTAFSTWGGPAQNMVYADDEGHIGYHALGKIPIRGGTALAGPLSAVPVSGVDPSRQWSGYIPFEQLPQIFDPPGGILATANSRITPDLYPFPITLNWAEPYRNERIWKVLSAGQRFTPADMLKLQTDVYSDVDRVIAQRFAYAIDHAGPHTSSNPKRLHQAADLLRNWNGNVDIDTPAPAIVDAARAALWPMLLIPKLGPQSREAAQLYTWGEKTFAEEQIILHTPDRWLPNPKMTWDDLLAGAVENGLVEAGAPQDLSKWTYGKTHIVDIEHQVYSLSPLIRSVLGLPIGTGPQPQSGNGTTVKQVGRTFGPSERFTADLSDLDQSTLNLVLGQSGNPLSPWFLDQFPAWYNNTTQSLPFTPSALSANTIHTLTLNPR